LIDDPGRREALGRKARLRAESDYGSQRLMQAIYSIYLSAARRERPAGPSASGVDEMATTIR
ncbi:MAG: hypothetical protein M3P18_06285, partial [Actinomycetota bacterium]|nr:hypothetical protein [Actinomycetota bacterium]